jgi:hypothetical protein
MIGDEGLEDSREILDEAVHRLPTPTVGPGFADILRCLVDGLAWVLMKGVASCDKPRVGACSPRSEDARMGLPTGFGRSSVRSGNPPN